MPSATQISDVVRNQNIPAKPPSPHTTSKKGQGLPQPPVTTNDISVKTSIEMNAGLSKGIKISILT